MPGAASPRSSTRICGVRLTEDTRATHVAREVSDQGWGCWPPFACQTAGSSPFTSAGTHRPSALNARTMPHSEHIESGEGSRGAASSSRLARRQHLLSTTRRGGAPVENSDARTHAYPPDLDGWPKAGRAGLCRAVVNDLRDASASDVARRAASAVRNARLGSRGGPGATMRHRNRGTAPVTFASTWCARGRL
jgi:hypothetical protein